jgi:hypothetical protein
MLLPEPVLTIIFSAKFTNNEDQRRQYQLLAGCECGCGGDNHRNHRHIADTQPADVNVRNGAANSELFYSRLQSGADGQLSPKQTFRLKVCN